MIISTAGIIFHSDRVLIAKRPADCKLPDLWEFPGGKLEGCEAPENALLRELKEELDIDAEITGIFDAAVYKEKTLELLVLAYCCRISDERQIPKPIEVSEYRWVKVEELIDYDFVPSDMPIRQKLLHAFRGL